MTWPNYAEMKHKCIEENVCIRCHKTNDNPQSFTCTRCREKHKALQHRLYKRAKLRTVIA